MLVTEDENKDHPGVTKSFTQRRLDSLWRAGGVDGRLHRRVGVADCLPLRLNLRDFGAVGYGIVDLRVQRCKQHLPLRPAQGMPAAGRSSRENRATPAAGQNPSKGGIAAPPGCFPAPRPRCARLENLAPGSICLFD